MLHPILFSTLRRQFHAVGLSLIIGLLAARCPAALAAQANAADSSQNIAHPTIHYTITLAGSVRAPSVLPPTRLHVEITVSTPVNAPLDFAIPAWTPGYYQILHYETGIHNVQAHDNTGHLLPVAHPTARTWHVAAKTVNTSLSATSPASPTAASTSSTLTATTATTTITLAYDVDAQDAGLGFFGSALDVSNQRGYVNGASALMYLVGRTQSPCDLSISAPNGWQVTTPLDDDTVPQASTSEPKSVPSLAGKDNTLLPTFHARTYDEMIDCPLQMGQFSKMSFQENGATFDCILVGRQAVGSPRMLDALRLIVRAAMQVFGKPPFHHYEFIYHIGGAGFDGGLEHHNSTVIHLPFGMGNGVSDEFLTISAHEFFHAWNVKRLRPSGLGPFDYTQPVRSGALWFAEGVTDYYAQLLLVRCGLKTRDWFWREITQRINQLDHTPSRVHVSLQEAGMRAWEGGSEGFDGLSYYLKGSLAGLYFDLRLRGLTHKQAGMDAVMRWLDANYGAKNAAYPESALLAALNAVSHADLSSEYNRLIASGDEIEWNEVFPLVGMQLHRDPFPFFGLRLAEEQDNALPGALIENAEAGHSAARMGLKAGDRLLRINDVAVTPASFSAAIHSLPANQPVTFWVQRGQAALRLMGVAGTVYEHHQLTKMPIGALNAAQQTEVKMLLEGLFAPRSDVLFGTDKTTSLPAVENKALSNPVER